MRGRGGDERGRPARGRAGGRTSGALHGLSRCGSRRRSSRLRECRPRGGMWLPGRGRRRRTTALPVHRFSGVGLDRVRYRAVPLLLMAVVKKMAKQGSARIRERGTTRISAKNRATIPVEALRKAGLRPGDVVRAKAAGPGRIVLLREEDTIRKFAGALTGVFRRGDLERLRREWR